MSVREELIYKCRNFPCNIGENHHLLGWPKSLFKFFHNILVFLGGTVAKNLPASAGDAGDLGSIPGLERSPGEGGYYHSSVLAWENSWTEESGRLQPMGSQRVGHN